MDFLYRTFPLGPGHTVVYLAFLDPWIVVPALLVLTWLFYGPRWWHRIASFLAAISVAMFCLLLLMDTIFINSSLAISRDWHCTDIKSSIDFRDIGFQLWVSHGYIALSGINEWKGKYYRDDNRSIEVYNDPTGVYVDWKTVGNFDWWHYGRLIDITEQWGMGMDPSGFRVLYDTDKDRFFKYFVKVPQWLVMPVLVPFPLLWIRNRRKWQRFKEREHRVEYNLCLNCGYDLRATPRVCPECGTEKPKNARIRYDWSPTRFFPPRVIRFVRRHFFPPR